MSQDKSGEGVQEVPVVDVSSEQQPEVRSKSNFEFNSGKSLATHTMQDTIEEGLKYVHAGDRHSDPVGASTRKKTEEQPSEKKVPKSSRKSQAEDKLDRQIEAKKSSQRKSTVHRTSTMQAVVE